MGIKCGIVGLPNVGKSTLFNALTAAEIPAENYPFCTIDPNVGVVTVPDPKLDALAAIVKPEKVVPTVVEFVDIAGLVEGASQGQGLGNQFLAHIRETHAIAHLVRCFVNDDIVHVAGKINPLHDIEIIDTELMLADSTVQKVHQRAEKAAKTNEKTAVARRDALKKLLDALENGKPARTVSLGESEADVLKELHLITAKPVMYIANVAEDSPEDNPLVAAVRKLAAEQGAEVVVISAAIEAELAQLPDGERAEFLASLGLDGAGVEPRHPLGLQAARTQDVLHGRAEGSARVDRQARRDGAASRGRDPHGLRARLHSRRGHRLRPVHRAPRRARRARSRRAAARRQDLRRPGRRRDSLQVQRLTRAQPERRT